MMASWAMSSSGMVNTVVLVFTLMAGLVVFLRLFTRGVLLRMAGLEDLCITFAMILSIGLTVTIALQVQNGMGKHLIQLTPQETLNSLKAFWASIWIYNLALTVTKISILLQYLRIFPTPGFRTTCRVVIGVVALYGLWTLFGSILLCFPVNFFWDKSISDGTCLDQSLIWFLNAAVNIAQDIGILLMPISVLRKLDIPAKQKRALIVVFGLGAVVCLVSIVRLQSLVTISKSADPTFDNPPAAMLSAIETNIGIICACLPSMRPLLSAMMPAYFPGDSRYVRTQDEEQANHKRYVSSSNIQYTTGSGSRSHSIKGSISRPYTSGQVSVSHSRNGSASRPYTPRSVGASHTRNGSNSRPYNPSTAKNSSHSRNDSSNSLASRHERELQVINMYSHHPTQMTTDRALAGSAQDLSLESEHQRHSVHPLRMSPFSPVMPRLPRLPENMGIFGPWDRSLRSPMMSRRASRTPVVLKPLPITPFPIMQGT